MLLLSNVGMERNKKKNKLNRNYKPMQRRKRQKYGWLPAGIVCWVRRVRRCYAWYTLVLCLWIWYVCVFIWEETVAYCSYWRKQYSYNSNENESTHLVDYSLFYLVDWASWSHFLLLANVHEIVFKKKKHLTMFSMNEAFEMEHWMKLTGKE